MIARIDSFGRTHIQVTVRCIQNPQIWSLTITLMNGTFAKSENGQGIQRWGSGCHIGIGFEQTELSDHLHRKVPGIRFDLVQTNWVPGYATGNRYLPTGARSHSKLLRYCSVWQTKVVYLCTPRSDDLADVLYWSRNTTLWNLEARKRQAIRCTQNQTFTSRVLPQSKAAFVVDSVPIRCIRCCF